ncbi:hypothetical protein [Pseudokineococcus lusitanus]|uniref:Uncharacterized protein n=1 Tax=Pseudokineococcus lusitanus TaxID=763993 RepID=A0A3N1HQU5_9ACTN|nr:hypothetical protein [Pseudokineococcus lusitanus]ROP44875.1 hypothetical protein EDC03_1005 [Pseudokineococcus lusitanus]
MGTKQVGRRVAGVLAGAVALGGLVVAPASATTTPDDVCAVQAYVPGYKVSIDAPAKDVPVTLLDDCDRTADVVIDVEGPEGAGYSFFYRPGQAQDVWFFSDEYPYGTYRFVAGAGTGDVQVRPVEVVVKYGARASLRGSRSGDDVTLRVQASYYDASKYSYQPLRDRRATIEILGKDGRTWQYLRSVTVPRTGIVDHTFTNRYAATYRVTTWETHNIFSRTSQAVTVPGR